MKVFISWSGERSQHVALAFRDWLPKILPGTETFVSSEDVRKGTRWSLEIPKELGTSDCGLICVLRENVSAPWLNFEAGAISKSFMRSRVFPFLLNLTLSELAGPLTQFQCTQYEKTDVKKMLLSLKETLGITTVSVDQVASTFEALWPELQAVLDEIITATDRSPIRDVFGGDILIPHGYSLIYAALSLVPVLQPGGQIERYPYTKQGEPDVRFSMEVTVSSCELRAAKYLTEMIAAQGKTGPSLHADVDVRSRLDFSFISFGGLLSNYKTRDVLVNSNNQLVTFDNARFTTVDSRRPIVNPRAGYDYGLILKIHPRQFPMRTWITCAGIGEWGTSGAAWYLGNKWKEIQEYFGDEQFAIIVRVSPLQDESADPIVRIRVPMDASNYVSNPVS